MQGNAAIIEALNTVLTAELTAINQYFIHAKMCENWGYKKLARNKHEESIEEMKHADRVIERILFLDGIPNMQRMDAVQLPSMEGAAAHLETHEKLGIVAWWPVVCPEPQRRLED